MLMGSSKNDIITIQGLGVECIIGIYDWERTTLQKVVIDLEMPCDALRASASDRLQDTVDYKNISKSVASFVESSQYFLLETLAENIARFCIQKFGLPKVGARVSKPGALRGAENVSISVSRKHSDYSENLERTVYLSIGSNIQPDQYIDRALQALQETVHVSKVSQVYETAPHGVAGQPVFLNLAAEICTELTETELKQKLLRLESDLGRVRTHDKFAPRIIDIDILIFDGQWKSTDSEAFQDITDQAFIMIPLTEIAPNLIEPKTGRKLLEIVAGRAYADHPMKCLGLWSELHRPAAVHR